MLPILGILVAFKKPKLQSQVNWNNPSFLFFSLAAQALGLPFISPYLQSIGSDYRHGANYATLASTVLLPNTSLFVTGISPFSLAIQLNQMKQFKVLVDEHHFSGTIFTSLHNSHVSIRSFSSEFDPLNGLKHVPKCLVLLVQDDKLCLDVSEV